MKDSLSRRSFLAGGAGALAIGALGMMGCSSGNAGSSSGTKWDEETDVVVMGFGGAGASAAIGASEAGASVIVLEKAPEGQEGGNTSASGGGAYTFYAAMPEFIRDQFPDTITNEEIDAYLKDLGELDAWFEAHGEKNGETVAYPATNGYGLFKWLKDLAINSPGVQVRYSTPMKGLVFDPATKEIQGVVIEEDGELKNIKAKRGVVMACGGFENNHDMLTAYYPPNVPIYPCGTPYNTGDGIPIVAAVGAKMRGFGSVEWGCHCCKAGSEEVGTALAFSFLNTSSYANAVIVNSAGKRFVNETSGGDRYDDAAIVRPLHAKEQLPELKTYCDPVLDAEGKQVNVTFRYENLPMYLIFGEQRMTNGEPLFESAGKKAGHCWASLRGLYSWSDDNQAEVDKGWIIKADTLEELAQKAGIDPAGLVATVSAYDKACADGSDPEFGRTHDLTPVGSGPYYACELGMSLINTQGGPARDGSWRVVDNDNNVIPRLYAGGEFGSIFVYNYPGGLNVAEALCTHVAGENAASLEPWC